MSEILDRIKSNAAATKSAKAHTDNANQLKTDYNKLKSKLKPKIGFFPPFADFLDLPAIKPLWSTNQKPKPKGKQSDLKQHSLAVDQVQALAQAIKDTVYSNLIEAHSQAESLPGGASQAGFDVDSARDDTDKVLMGRVTSAIECPRLGCPVWDTFPTILDHACSDHILRGTYENVGEYKFADNPLRTTGEKIAAIRMVLTAAGEREKTADIETLDQLAWKLTCKGCPNASRVEISLRSCDPGIDLSFWSFGPGVRVVDQRTARAQVRAPGPSFPAIGDEPDGQIRHQEGDGRQLRQAKYQVVQRKHSRS